MVNKKADRRCGGFPRQAEDMTAKIDMKEKNTSRVWRGLVLRS